MLLLSVTKRYLAIKGESMNYLKRKRNQFDYCNICGKKKNLTWDHVPPKSTGNNSEIITNRFGEGLPRSNSYQKKYQSGIKFRTICEECNGNLLGYYDIEYKKFIEDIKYILNANLLLPNTINLTVKINKICRAICGHFLAAKDFYDNESVIDNELRKYVLNPNLSGKNVAKLYYWLYPYNTVLIIRDVVTSSYTGQVAFPSNCISIINSFPLAIILDDGEESQCKLNNLMCLTSENIEDTVNISLDLSSVYYPDTKKNRHFMWPCNISNEWDGAAMILGGESMMEDSRVGIKL